MKVGDYVFSLDGFDTAFGKARPRLKIITDVVAAGYACRAVEGNQSIFFRLDQIRLATAKEVKDYKKIYPEVDWYLED
jgi:hypothetical protein